MNKPTAFLEEIYVKPKPKWYKDKMFWATFILLGLLLTAILWSL